MKRLLMLAALAAVTAAVVASPVRAAPIPGATHVSGTWTDPIYLYTYAAGGTAYDGLTGLGCPFIQHDYGDNALGTLTAKYNGWIGPVDQVTFLYPVLLRAHVTGTIEDAAGNTYTVSGNFTDTTTRFLFDNDLLFDGVGKETISGPMGVVVGTAEFRAVNAPLELSSVFSSITKCTISS